MKNHIYKMGLTIVVLLVLLLFVLLFPRFSDNLHAYKIVLYASNAFIVLIGIVIVRAHILSQKTRNN